LYKSWLAQLAFEQFGSVPSRNTLTDVITAVEGVALFGSQARVH
jgi:hypothetical protein